MNTKARAYAKQLGKLIVLFLCVVLIGYGLLVAVYMLPVERMEHNLVLSKVTFDGTDPEPEERNQKLVKTYNSTWLDNVTDAYMMLEAVYKSNDPAWKQALDNVYYRQQGEYSFQTVRDFDPESTQELGSRSYFHYWHGYLVFLKPLLMVCTYMDIRIINMLCQGALMVALVMLLYKRGLKRYVVAFALSLVCLSPWTMPFTMHYSTVFYIFAIAMVVMLQWPRFAFERLGDTALFMLIGMATSYFDFLSYPLASFGMPFVLRLMLLPKNDGSVGSYIGLAIKLGVAWLAGYAGMWAMKWVLCQLLSNPDAIRSAIGEVFLRMSGGDDQQGVNRSWALMRNLNVLLRKPYKLLYGAMAVAWLVRLLKNRKRLDRICMGKLPVLVAVALLPIVWYLLIVGHSHGHYYFTHKALAVTAFALCVALSDVGSTDAQSTAKLPLTTNETIGE